MGHVSRRQFLTTTGPASPASSPPASRRRGASSARSPTSAGTTSRPAPTRSWPRSASASPRTPASRSASTTSAGPPAGASTPPRCRPRPGHDVVEMRMHFPWLYEPQLVDVSDLVAELEKKYGKALPSAKETRQRQGGLARGAAVPRHLRGRLPRGPLQEGQPQGPRHLGGPLHGRQGAEEDGEPDRDPHQPELRLDLDGGTRAVVLRRHGGRQGRQDRRDQLARPPCRWSSGTRRCTATAWSRRCCPGPTPATTSRSSRARRAGSTTRCSAYIVASNSKLVTADGINHHRSLAGPTGAPRDRRAAPHRHLEVLEEHRAVQGVDPLPARQARGLRRVHHVGRRLQPAGVRRTCRTTPCSRPIRSSPRSRTRACSSTPTAGRRRRATRSSSSPTRSSCPT